MLTSRRPHSFYTNQLAEERSPSPPALVIPNRNLFLAELPEIDANKLIAAVKPVQLNAGDVIYETNEPIDYVYFPIDSVISAIALTEDGSSVEIFMTGREGVAGLSAIVGGGRGALHWTRVSVGGTALRIKTTTLQSQFKTSDIVQRGLMRAYRELFTQICQRSVCNVRHTLLQRLCVWLLMIQDRIGTPELPFTQEEIANRISVRRAGISVAASMLQSLEAISYRRGKIVITDSSLLQHVACECQHILRQGFVKENDEARGANRASHF